MAGVTNGSRGGVTSLRAAVTVTRTKDRDQSEPEPAGPARAAAALSSSGTLKRSLFKVQVTPF